MSTIEIGMMVAFVLALGFSGWKLYAFMPSKPLEDDDTNTTSVETLNAMMYDVISEGHQEEEHILEKMKAHPDFDAEHFWRFNHNRLKQLLQQHYLKYPHHQNIQDIHKHLKESSHTNENK